MSISQWLLLVFLSLLWGASFLFIGIAVQELPPFTLVLARVGIAAVILLVIVCISGIRMPRAIADWKPFAVMALLNNVVPFLLIVRGQQSIASGLASVLNATTPLFALLFAHFLTTDEKLVANRLAGVLVGVVGVAILVGPEALVGNTASTLGMACVLLAAVSYAASGLWGRRFKGTPPLVTACSQLICSTLVLAPLALVIDRPWLLPTPGNATIGAVVGLAALSTALAYIVFFRIMAVSGPTNTMLVTLLIPVSAIVFGAVILGERLLARQLIGAALIGLALLIIDGRPVEALRQRISGRA
jgi:drug/metabolite transporter (DMT)-like permease